MQDLKEDEKQPSLKDKLARVALTSENKKPSHDCWGGRLVAPNRHFGFNFLHV